MCLGYLITFLRLEQCGSRKKFLEKNLWMPRAHLRTEANLIAIDVDLLDFSRVEHMDTLVTHAFNCSGYTSQVVQLLSWPP